jgi:hypothetical protein
MNHSRDHDSHRLDILTWLESKPCTYDELLARSRRNWSSDDVNTNEALAVLIGAMIGEGLLEREVAPEGEPQAGAVQRMWLSEKGRSAIASASPSQARTP